MMWATKFKLPNDKHSALEARIKVLGSDNDVLRIENEALKTQVKNLQDQVALSAANHLSLKHGVFWNSNGAPQARR